MSLLICSRYMVHILGVFTMLLSGCLGEDPTNPQTPDASKLYASVRLSHKAIILSLHQPYDTVQLRAIPLSLLGDTLKNVDRLEFRRLNVFDESISVDSTGLVSAKQQSKGSRIVVSATIGSITREDTATIMVRSELPVRFISRIEFDPLPPDSSHRWAGTNGAIGYERWVRLYDLDDGLIAESDVVVDYDLGDRTITANADVTGRGFSSSQGRINGYFFSVLGSIGKTYITARTYAYGRVLEDSTQFQRVDPPLRFVVIDRVVPVDGVAELRFFPQELDIRVGTTVAFFNSWGMSGSPPIAIGTGPQICSGPCGNRITKTGTIGGFQMQYVDSVDILFTGPASPESGDRYSAVVFRGLPSISLTDTSSGNISLFSAVARSRVMLDDGRRARKFSVPGIYQVKSEKYPYMKMTIHVH